MYTPDRLVLVPLPNGSDWQLQHEYRYFPKDGTVVTVPAGFVTDFASTPQLMWRLFPPATGKYRVAAVVHDWLYRMPKGKGLKPTMTREDADAIFLEVMEACGTGWFTRRSMYSAVRMFGGSSYVE